MPKLKSRNIQVFMSLLRAGLWEKDVLTENKGVIDFNEVYSMAEDQSVVGLVAAGIEHAVGFTIPQDVALTFAGSAIQMEQRNKEMNAFISKLVKWLEQDEIHTLLVKGQGIAQCYERPLWRTSGDVDLFLSDGNYDKAKFTLQKLATTIEQEDTFCKHLAMVIDGWNVELHGTLRTQLGKRIDDVVDIVQEETFSENKFRVWNNENTDVNMPSPDNDIIFVFTHILKHFFKEGIGLRQFCDLYRLIWVHRTEINEALLHERLMSMNMLTEWRVFAMLGVNYLGVPYDAMPLLDSSDRYKKKAENLLSFIFETGNFGHRRDNTYYLKYPFVIYKAISLYRHLTDSISHFMIFPFDSIKMLLRNIINGGVSVINEVIIKKDYEKSSYCLHH